MVSYRYKIKGIFPHTKIVMMMSKILKLED